jgi:anti-anti-sigma factor
MAPFDHCSFDLIDGVVVVSGELDGETSPYVADAVLQLVGPHAARVFVDLREVTFIDSGGLHALLRLRRTRPVDVIGVSPRVDRILDISGTRLLILGPTPAAESKN